MKNVTLSGLAAAGLFALTAQAGAQWREFYCGEQTTLTVKAIDAKTVSAGLINGKTVALKQNPKKPLSFSSGKVMIDIAKDQKSVVLTTPNDEPITCVYPIPDDAMADATEPAGKDPVVVKQPGGGKTPASVGPASLGKGVTAKSWGGVVRSGPGMDYDKLASLKEGDKITLLENANADMNGYAWFKIRYGGNKTGYQWGGIICAIGKPMPGVFEVCK